METEISLKVYDGKKKLNIPLFRITHIKANKEYVEIFTSLGKCYCKCSNIGKIEKLVKPSNLFFKPHKSFLINKRFLEGSERTLTGLYAIVKNNYIPISRRKAHLFNNVIGEITVG